jgi:hypothetical protein
MSYQINRTDGTSLTVIEDGLVDSTTSLKLVGRNVVNFGATQNENFVYLLENFANITPPSGAISGQLWYDSTVNRIKLYDANRWNQLPSVIASTTATGQVAGDFWFNTGTNILYVQSGNGYVQIGPIMNVTSANHLTTATTVNGVSFNGSSPITVSSTTTNSLSAGSYLTGTDFNGSAPVTFDVNVGTVTSPDPFAVVARDSSGDIYFNTGHGTASAARFADLAEKYLISGGYEIGTVVAVGGPAEVKACALNDRAIGVVSEKPAYMMNSDLKGGVYIALKGRVPTNVRGAIKKGDRLIAGADGRAINAGKTNNSNVFAIALEDNNGSDRIEALVL